VTAAFPRLTILLPRKGRPLFTLRFLWHAEKARLPYRFLIADGQVEPRLAELLENSREVFPHLDIEYVRYPNDVDFSHFYRKLLDAAQRVRTPYTMVVDNDDFLAFTGLERSLDFLEKNPDYVCCGGGLAGFSVYSGLGDLNHGLVGPFNKFSYRYTIHDRSREFSSTSVVDRLRQGSRNWWSYYAVFRAGALVTIWREVVEVDFSDLQLFEFFCAMRTLTLGKSRSDRTTIAYLRQYNTSLRSAYSKDWVHHLLRSRFTDDFDAMISRISALAATADGVDQKAVAEMLRNICEEWLREFLRVNFGEVQGLKQILRDRTPGLVTWLKKRRRAFVGRERAALFLQLAKDGASESYREAFRKELEAIEDVLTGPTFSRFIQPFAVEFGARGSAVA
jgi:glycosyltransferase domain-containing protein